VAKEKNVPLLDLNAESSAAVQAMGEAAADGFAALPPGSAQTGQTPSPPASTEVNDRPMAAPHVSFDHTHLGRAGADYFAKMVTKELATAVPEMRPLLIP
jgi:lysophospholipase L1-like esterase